MTELYAPASSEKPRLRVGLLLDGWLVPAWVERIVHRLLVLGDAEIVCVVLNTAPPSKRVFWQSILQEPKTFLYRLYAWADQKIFSVSDDAFSERDLKKTLPTVLEIPVQPVLNGARQHFSAEDLVKIREARPDVLLRFGFGILSGEILTVAEGGVWSHHHGDPRFYRGRPPGFWELLHGESVMGGMVQQLSERLDAGCVLAESWSAVNPLSVHRTKQGVYWKMTEMIPRLIREWRREGYEAFMTRRKQDTRFHDRPLYGFPGTGAMLRFLCRWFPAALARLSARWSGNHWHLRVGLKPSLAFRRWKKILPPKGRFWADPCVVEAEEKTFLFFEDASLHPEHGRIAVAEIGASGVCTNPRTVLEESGHLSYPCVFRADEDWYLLPEMSSMERQDLYRARRFPDVWENVSTLFQDVRMYDATPFFYQGLWWLFATVRVHPRVASWDELFLFSAKTVTGPWRPHHLRAVC